jgi:hypothetical protein
VPQISIPKENFFEEDIFIRKESIRYRIVSENKNNFSYWSPIFSVDPGFDFIPANKVSVSRTSTELSASWTPAQIKKDGIDIAVLPEYDVWIRLGLTEATGDWIYSQRVIGNSFSLVEDVSVLAISYASVEVYRPMRPADQRIDLYEVNQSTGASLVDTIKDTIIMPTTNISNGDAMRYTSSTPLGGLLDDTTYYARVYAANEVTFHPTKLDAIGNTNIVDITSTNNFFGYFKSQESLVYDFLLYSEYNVSS